MLRHIVLLTLADTAGEHELAAMEEGLNSLPAIIPELLAYSVKRDAGLSEGNATIAIVGDFEDQDGYRAYADHPVHLQVIAEKIKPVVQSRAAVQVEL